MNRDFIGLLWLFTEKFGATLISTVTFLVYSFYLTPAQLGNATIALSIALILSQTIVTVLQDPIVCAKAVTKSLISSCLWFNLIVATFFLSLICLLAQFNISQSELKILIQSASPVLVFAAVNTIYSALLRRQKRFRALALRQFYGRIIGALVGIGFVYTGFGPLSMVLQMVCIEAFALMSVMLTFTLKPKLSLNWRDVSKLLIRGVPIAIKKVSWESFARGIPLVLGVFVSPTQVGFFAFAWRIVDMPRAAIHSASLSFILPYFSPSKSSRHTAIDTYLYSTKLMSIVTTPFFLLLALFSEPLLMWIFGEKWQEAAPLVSLLSIVPLLANFRVFAPSLFTSLNRSNLGTKTDVMSTILSLLLCAAVAPTYGATAGVMAFIARMLMNLPITVLYLKNLIGVTWRHYVLMYKSTYVPLLLVLPIHFSGWITMEGSMLIVQFLIELFLFMCLFLLLEEQKSDFLMKVKHRS